MGVIWAVEDSLLEQSVALKVLPEIILHDSEAITDLKRETKRCLRPNHHNIVRIYNFIQNKSEAAISRELVEGETLAVRKFRSPSSCLEPGDIIPWLPPSAKPCPTPTKPPRSSTATSTIQHQPESATPPPMSE